MQSVFNVQCMLCGRMSGQIRNGAFRRLSTAPPLVNRNGRRWCGYCGGNVYLEHDDSGTVAFEPATSSAAYQQRRAS